MFATHAFIYIYICTNVFANHTYIDDLFCVSINTYWVNSPSLDRPLAQPGWLHRPTVHSEPLPQTESPENSNSKI